MTEWKPVLVSAVLFMILAQVIHTLFAFAGMGFYLDPALFGLWSSIMMPEPGPPPLEFYCYSLAFGFITALIYVGVYKKIGSAVPGNNKAKRGLNYGFFVLFLLGSVPGYLSIFLLINVPPALLGMWAFEALIIALLGGMIITKFNQT